MYVHCNEHEWVGGKSGHEDLVLEEHSLEWFDRRNKDFEALQKIVQGPQLLPSFKFYMQFK